MRLVTLHIEDDGEDCNSFHLRFCPVEGHLWKVAFLVTQIEGSSRVRGWWYRQSDFGCVLPCQTTGTWPLALARTIVAQLLGPEHIVMIMSMVMMTMDLMGRHLVARELTSLS